MRKIMKHLRRTILMLSLLLLLGGQSLAQTFKPGAEFTLRNKESAKVTGTGIEISVSRIGRKWSNKGSQLDFTFNVKHDGVTKYYSSPLPSLIVAGDYEIKVIKTDPGSYGSATFLVKQNVSNSTSGKSPASPGPPLPKSHRHIGVTRSAVGENITEFSLSEIASARFEKENRVSNRSRTFEAFTDGGTKLFIRERSTGKVFEIRGLPLEWRPFSDLIWADNRTLMFDRWSQPHYGVHYAVDMESKRLIAAVPFPDKWFSEQPKPK